ncbi:BON domain-containing protein [Hymenobacter elongatus]|uniref:BON domain-containing protein n=1 Tax=Hymenobacter elongatus TaxID=877208 RepID=A0A4Z0PNS0_9BACT|nr:BON domain-containing protein [Hymenobacter elongatus]
MLLTGLVATLFEQEQAGDVAAGVSGVVDVNNRLEVSGINANLAEGLSASFLGEDKLSPATPDPDQALAARIRARYCWSASLHDQEMDVRVEDGRATLTGTVDTWLNRKHAAEAAHEAGAREVNNHLLVLPSAPVPNKHLAAAAHESLA